MHTLNQQIAADHSRGVVSSEAPACIRNNLNPRFELRPYQIDAFVRFIYYFEQYPHSPKPLQLLFHMATGSGKTLIMAGIILYLYRHGYRNFIFFVNSSNIIEKTRDNFLNASSPKYLFSESISFGDRQITIREVDTFETAGQNDLNIVFTTIQGLHSKLNAPKENNLTYDAFEDKRIVLISDEAHHINAETKKGKQSKSERERIISWEGTVSKIFNSNEENMLLEFTATADLSHPEIAQKYHDKILYDYPLKQFRLDKYSKDVQVLQADLNPFERALQAIILSQYRQKIFERYGLHIKPVVLLKSKSIKESRQFFEEFNYKIKHLTPAVLVNIRENNPNKVIAKAFRYFDSQNISTENLILELQSEFAEDKCISVNSQNDSEAKQLIVNNLEAENNAYRAVFAVDKLNEGWDVLNLFDIVRLYNTRDAARKGGSFGETTLSEAQLIGRGARYCPFRITNEQPVDQRKYDDQPQHELRICEELFYHSAHNPRYIAELNKALQDLGLKAKKTIRKKITLKESFKKSDFYRTGVIYVNKRIAHNRSNIFELDESIRNRIYKAELRSGYSVVSNAFTADRQNGFRRGTKRIKLNRFPLPLLRKALSKLPFYQFSRLLTYFPHLTSMSEFISSDKYLNRVTIEIKGRSDQINRLTPQMELQAATQVLDEISVLIAGSATNYKGSKDFTPHSLSSVFNDKIVNIALDGNESFNPIKYGRHDITKETGFVLEDFYATDPELSFIAGFQKIFVSLKNNYDEIYLIKNAGYFKLFSFKDGQTAAPDFVLFLIKKGKSQSLVQQIFISINNPSLHDSSRVDFFKQIEREYRISSFPENVEYKISTRSFFKENEKPDAFVLWLSSL